VALYIYNCTISSITRHGVGGEVEGGAFTSVVQFCTYGLAEAAAADGGGGEDDDGCGV
jgi:hypothetical protein